MFQEHKFCFTMEVISKQGLQKPFVTVCSTYFTILKTESGLFDKFVSQISQAHYISALDSRNSRIDFRDSILKSFFD